MMPRSPVRDHLDFFCHRHSNDRVRSLFLRQKRGRLAPSHIYGTHVAKMILSVKDPLVIAIQRSSGDL